MEFQQFIDSLVNRVAGSASVKTVFGEPVQVNEKTIIPVAKVRYGFGGGAGRGKNNSEGEGYGAGGGVAATPVGVMEITGEKTTFIAATNQRKMLLLAIASLSAGLLLGRRLYRKKELKATDTNFSL